MFDKLDAFVELHLERAHVNGRTVRPESPYCFMVWISHIGTKSHDTKRGSKCSKPLLVNEIVVKWLLITSISSRFPHWTEPPSCLHDPWLSVLLCCGVRECQFQGNKLWKTLGICCNFPIFFGFSRVWNDRGMTSKLCLQNMQSAHIPWQG